MNRRDGSPIVTPQCIAHDAAVDNALLAGKSHVQAQWGALGKLGPAAASWAKAWFADRFAR